MKTKQAPWLLPLHEVMLIANTHRVGAGAVQEIARSVHRELTAENERLRSALRQMEAAGHELRTSNERWGLTERRKKAVQALAAERERAEALRQALSKCKTCALPTEVRELVNAALRA